MDRQCIQNGKEILSNSQRRMIFSASRVQLMQLSNISLSENSRAAAKCLKGVVDIGLLDCVQV